MIYAIVGAGGKTGLLKEMAARFREEGKSVFVTTTTHMFIEGDTMLTDDPAVLLAALEEKDSATAMVYACELEGGIEHVYERQALTLENIF